MTFHHADHYTDRLDDVIEKVQKINKNKFEGVRAEKWYQYFPLFRCLVN